MPPISDSRHSERAMPPVIAALSAAMDQYARALEIDEGRRHGISRHKIHQHIHYSHFFLASRRAPIARRQPPPRPYRYRSSKSFTYAMVRANAAAVDHPLLFTMFGDTQPARHGGVSRPSPPLPSPMMRRRGSARRPPLPSESPRPR